MGAYGLHMITANPAEAGMRSYDQHLATTAQTDDLVEQQGRRAAMDDAVRGSIDQMGYPAAGQSPLRQVTANGGGQTAPAGPPPAAAPTPPPANGGNSATGPSFGADDAPRAGNGLPINPTLRQSTAPAPSSSPSPAGNAGPQSGAGAASAAPSPAPQAPVQAGPSAAPGAGGGISSPTMGQRPPTTNYAPLISALGHSRYASSALPMITADQQQKSAAFKRAEDMERGAMQALANGDMTTFEYFRAKAGIQVPPEVLQDGYLRQTFARGALIAEKVYREDPEHGGRFVQAYIASGGNIQQAFLQAGPPRQRPNMTPTDVEMEGRRVLAMVDHNTGNVTIPHDGSGQPYGRPDPATLQRGTSVPVADPDSPTGFSYAQRDATGAVDPNPENWTKGAPPPSSSRAQRPVAVVDPTQPSGYRYEQPGAASGQPAPAPRAEPRGGQPVPVRSATSSTGWVWAKRAADGSLTKTEEEAPPPRTSQQAAGGSGYQGAKKWLFDAIVADETAQGRSPEEAKHIATQKVAQGKAGMTESEIRKFATSQEQKEFAAAVKKPTGDRRRQRVDEIADYIRGASEQGGAPAQAPAAAGAPAPAPQASAAPSPGAKPVKRFDPSTGGFN